MSEKLRPARPGTGLTEDGRRLQVLTTYARRGSRLTATQQAAWERRRDHWLVPESAVDEPAFDPARWFGREAPLIVEIGSGNGEALAALAAARPAYDVLAFEVWRPGIASTFLELEERGVGNVRLLAVDAVWCLEHLFAPEQLAELWTFFPDPWHKKRHHKRRLVSPSFASVAASRLQPGGLWRLATDWGDYAEKIEEVLGAEPLLTGGRTERWGERPVTKFERRALAEGRSIADLCYRRV
jgi:tRNA (guanine-N7-)-methyltransferase